MNLEKLLKYRTGKEAFFEVLSQYPKNWQDNTTPYSIVNSMVSNTSLENKKILVLFNIEFLEVLVNKNNVNPENIYYIADNELEMLAAQKIYKVNAYCSSHQEGVVGLKKLIESI